MRGRVQYAFCSKRNLISNFSFYISHLLRSNSSFSFFAAGKRTLGIRRWRRFSHPAPWKQAFRSTDGECEPAHLRGKWQIRSWSIPLPKQKTDHKGRFLDQCKFRGKLVIRRWRRFSHPATWKQAFRSSDGECEPAHLRGKRQVRSWSIPLPKQKTDHKGRFMV